MFKSLIIACFMLTCSIEAKGTRHLYLDSPHYIGGAGFFHNFNIVLGCLDLYDKCDYLGLTVDFKTDGLYYEEAYGPNWWSYYFEPIHLLPKKADKKAPIMKCFKDEEKGAIGNAAHFYMDRDHAHTLINRYIKVDKKILQEVDEFYNEHLKEAFIIGVHYRGTDKHLEADVISYNEVIKTLRQHLGEVEYKIFVATDEPEFLDCIKQEFAGKVYASDAQRIENLPVHYTSTKCFLKGKEALVDCLLLSKSDLLIRTHSNLSAVAAYFNPKVPVVNLNSVNSVLYEGILKNGTPNELNSKF